MKFFKDDTICNDELTSIRNNGKHPTCELEAGHEGPHKINNNKMQATWHRSNGVTYISNYESTWR